MCWVVYIRLNRCLSRHFCHFRTDFLLHCPMLSPDCHLVATGSDQCKATGLIDVTYSTHMCQHTWHVSSQCISHLQSTINSHQAPNDVVSNKIFKFCWSLIWFSFSLIVIEMLLCCWSRGRDWHEWCHYHIPHSPQWWYVQLSGAPDPTVSRTVSRPTSYPLASLTIFMGNYSLGSYYPPEYQGLFVIFSKWWKV